jgi:hypothetical protein
MHASYMQAVVVVEPKKETADGKIMRRFSLISAPLSQSPRSVYTRDVISEVHGHQFLREKKIIQLCTRRL